MLPPHLNRTHLRTVDHPSEFADCRDQFLTTPLANSLLRWCFPGLSRQAVIAQTKKLLRTEDFQFDYVQPMLQRVLHETSQGLSISGLDQLPTDRKFLFISNHRCIVTDAALVALKLLSSGRGTCKVCVGDNLMSTAGVSELMLLLNGVVIKRSGTRRDVYASAKQVSAYLAQQIEEQRYSIWLSQSPGRTKNGNDRTDPAIIKMLGLAGTGNHADFEKLHIVPVAISYEFEPCATYKGRETLLKQEHGAYHKAPGEDLAQIHSSLTADKGRVHLAFGEEIRLNGSAGEDAVQEVADQVDAQIWRLYRSWESNQIAHALLTPGSHDLDTPYAKFFLEMIASQVAELTAMGLPSAPAREALLQLYAQPVFNAQRAAALQPASRSQGKA
ncbi:1-acyl-sn-glycerol-3-phosphate acyltransferase [Simplicispira psychrophila]|uniref:1-acyl-sn-glycerol-3-phosphate acyltransferase n=1 Tax=Simplicispira psychrophila TaxID=80882 RepID=UPI00068972B1|nr:1-acyl-sn-glycerol-3-phosphate acyltransferase [Simplicispira psychrophila]